MSEVLRCWVLANTTRVPSRLTLGSKSAPSSAKLTRLTLIDCANSRTFVPRPDASSGDGPLASVAMSVVAGVAGLEAVGGVTEVVVGLVRWVTCPGAALL